MNWQMTGVIVSVIIACTTGMAKLISALVKNYFTTLSARMTTMENNLLNHTTAEQAYQNTVTSLLSSMQNSLTRIDATSVQYVSTTTHLEALRTIDKSITDARHAVRNELQVLITKVESDSLQERVEIVRRLERLEGFGGN